MLEGKKRKEKEIKDQSRQKTDEPGLKENLSQKTRMILLGNVLKISEFNF